MSRTTQTILAMALAAAAVIWFLEQRNTQTTATENNTGSVGTNGASAGSP